MSKIKLKPGPVIKRNAALWVKNAIYGIPILSEEMEEFLLLFRNKSKKEEL